MEHKQIVKPFNNQQFFGSWQLTEEFFLNYPTYPGCLNPYRWHVSATWQVRKEGVKVCGQQSTSITHSFYQ